MTNLSIFRHLNAVETRNYKIHNFLSFKLEFDFKNHVKSQKSVFKAKKNTRHEDVKQKKIYPTQCFDLETAALLQ